MRDLVSISTHPSNLDPTSVLVSGPMYRERDIYRCRLGFVACIAERAIAGHFDTQDAAESAQREFGRE